MTCIVLLWFVITFLIGQTSLDIPRQGDNILVTIRTFLYMANLGDENVWDVLVVTAPWSRATQSGSNHNNLRPANLQRLLRYRVSWTNKKRITPCFLIITYIPCVHLFHNVKSMNIWWRLSKYPRFTPESEYVLWPPLSRYERHFCECWNYFVCCISHPLDRILVTGLGSTGF